MISKISEKSRTKESIRLEEYYNQWRKISWDNKEEKLNLLTKIDKIADCIEDEDSEIVAYYLIRIAII